MIERGKGYSVSRILYRAEVADGKGKDSFIVSGNRIRISMTLRTFMRYGVKCAGCGTKARYFTIFRNEKGSFLQLFAYDGEGKEVLMTKDHIVPRSKGGADDLKNYQPMCAICNTKKGNRYDYEEDCR